MPRTGIQSEEKGRSHRQSFEPFSLADFDIHTNNNQKKSYIYRDK